MTSAYKSMTLRMTGVAPLIMHSSRLADPLDPASVELAGLTRKRAKTRADHELIAQHEWYACLWLDDGCPCIPAEVVEATFVAAAKTQRAAPVARAGLICPSNVPLLHDGPEDLGLTPLARSTELDTAATAHSADMVSHNYLDHEGSDGSTPQDRAVRAALV